MHGNITKLSAPTDNAEGDTDTTNLEDTELTNASKDVVLVVTHGVCVVGGATSAIIKCLKGVLRPEPNHNNNPVPGKVANPLK